MLQISIRRYRKLAFLLLMMLLLTQTVARHAEAHGCGWVVLSTGAEMDSAVRTYNGLGFNGYARSKSMVFAATPKQLLPTCEA